MRSQSQLTITQEGAQKTLNELITEWNTLSQHLDDKDRFVQQLKKLINQQNNLTLGEKIQNTHTAVEYAKTKIKLQTVLDYVDQMYGKPPSTSKQKQAASNRREGKIRLKVMKLI